MKYIVAILLSFVLLLGWQGWSLRKNNVELNVTISSLKTDISSWREKAEKAIAQEGIARQQCKIGEDITYQTDKDNKALDTSTGVTLRELAKQPHDKLLEKIIDANQKPIMADDARLSSAAMRLLNEAFCAGAKDDPYCSSSNSVNTLHPATSGRQ